MKKKSNTTRGPSKQKRRRKTGARRQSRWRRNCKMAPPSPLAPAQCAASSVRNCATPPPPPPETATGESIHSPAPHLSEARRGRRRGRSGGSNSAPGPAWKHHRASASRGSVSELKQVGQQIRAAARASAARAARTFHHKRPRLGPKVRLSVASRARQGLSRNWSWSWSWSWAGEDSLEARRPPGRLV